MLSASIGTNPLRVPIDVPAFEEVGGFKRSLQLGYEKREPNQGAFKMLPRTVVNQVGERSHKGTRLDLAVLSHLMYHNAHTEPGSVQFEQGFVEGLEDGEFIVSMQTTAEDILSRWTHGLTRDDIENPDGSRTKSFEAFYRSVTRAFKRLERLGHIEKRRYAGGKHNGLYGTVWRLSDGLRSHADKCQDCPEAPPVLIHAQVPLDGEFVNAVDRIGSQFLSESSEHYTEGEACTAVTQRGRYLNHDNWCDVVAMNEPDGPRHVSVGAFKPSKWIGEASSCTVPWVILEPEDGDIVDRHEATCRILETMHEEGVDISRVVITFSGNQSFHIRIPQGMFGNPVYASAEECRKILSRWAYDTFEERLDVNLFDPRHLIRCTGSKHEKGGRVVPFSGDEFMSMGLQDVFTTTDSFNPHRASPRFAPQSPWLMLGIAEAADSFSRFWIMDFRDAPTISESGAFAAAMKGCEEGEQWHEKHSGRNKLCFVAACYLIRKYGEEVAYPELEAVNDRNTPPLPDRELRACFKSAQRTINRKKP